MRLNHRPQHTIGTTPICILNAALLQRLEHQDEELPRTENRWT
jgi:hypothetical protein